MTLLAALNFEQEYADLAGALITLVWKSAALRDGSLRPVPQKGLPVTVVIPTLNEAVQIRSTVQNVSWADEVIVVDGGSIDATEALAREAGATVLRVLGKTIAAQRNSGIAAARNTWILALDADERVPDALRRELESVLAAPRHEAYRVRLRNVCFGYELRHGVWGRDWHVRLFRQRRQFIERRVHERLEAVEDVGSLVEHIEHRPYRSFSQYFDKLNRYAQWGAEDLYGRGRRTNVLDVTFAPLWRFLREYFLFNGWRDGRPGFVAAALSSCAALLKYVHLATLEWEGRRMAPTVLAQSDGEILSDT